MNTPATGWSLTIPPLLWDKLSAHLFPGDGDEHGAVILAGLAAGRRGPRLLARDFLPAEDRVDYVPGHSGYRALTTEFINMAIDRAEEEGLGYIAVHCHGGTTRVSFSSTDLASHERGYPAISQIIERPVGGLVLTPQAAAGRLLLPDGEWHDLAEIVVPSGNLLRLRPSPSAVGQGINPEYDRQSRAYGATGQALFGQMRVAVVGLGGIGSILVELIARLGVGHLVLIDPEKIDPTNLPRMVAARRLDALPWFRHDGKPALLKRVGEALATSKTRLAARNARRANPRIKVTKIVRDVSDPRAAAELSQVDWIFLAADSNLARYETNAVIQQYLIPGTQVGVSIPVDEDGTVGDIHIAIRPLLPGTFCLMCNSLINVTDLAVEAKPDQERAQARYVRDVPAASVMTLNAIAAGEAANHFMLAAVGLHEVVTDYDGLTHQPRHRDRDREGSRQRSSCRWCSGASQSAFALGDARRLPTIARP
ncbi:ThiF family adenylyltransferase [Nonomuraea fuscirosea]|uniref:ThiF family adenylyltransferase n=1 Tax=Nonomuraea fuscirosea TaxID=1291556 RepID=UPI003402FBD5